MKFNAVIGCGFKFIGVKIFYYSSLPTCTNGLLTSWAACEYFYMHYVMALSSKFSIKIGSTIKNEVSRLHFLKLKCNWKSVKLICLVPTVKIET